MQPESSGDRPIADRENLGQLGGQHAFNPLLVASETCDEMAVDEDAALILNVDDFEAWRNRTKTELGRSVGRHEGIIAEAFDISNYYLTNPS